MKILHVSCFLKKEIPLSGLKKLLPKLPYQKIALFSTAQHLPQLQKVKDFLESEGKQITLGGQILGCDFDKVKEMKDKVEAFLYLGSGKFHPLGIAIHSHKSVVILNPYSLSLDNISEEEVEKYQKRRKGAIAKAAGAEIFGILVSLKTGQFHLKKAEDIKGKLKNGGKKAFLFAGDQISPERLLGFRVDAWINTACPRLIEDYFEKPMLNPGELEIIL